MLWYHGGYKYIDKINLNRGNKRTDFGRAFYLGSSFEMAKMWAKEVLCHTSQSSNRPFIGRLLLKK